MPRGLLEEKLSICVHDLAAVTEAINMFMSSLLTSFQLSFCCPTLCFTKLKHWKWHFALREWLVRKRKSHKVHLMQLTMVLEVTARAEVNESHFLISSEFPRQEPLKSQQGLAFPLFSHRNYTI